MKQLTRKAAGLLAAVLLLCSVMGISALAAADPAAEEFLQEAGYAEAMPAEEAAEEAADAVTEIPAEAGEGASEEAAYETEDGLLLFEEEAPAAADNAPLSDGEAAAAEEAAGAEEGMILNANGGLFPDGKEVQELSYTTEYLNSDSYFPSREGYVFTGWYADTAGKKALSGKERVTELSAKPKAGTTLYAGWSTDFYEITFDANGGYIREWNSDTHEYDKLEKMTCKVIKGKSYSYSGISVPYPRDEDDNSSSGWYRESDPLNVFYIDSDDVPAASETFLAYWPPKVSFHAGQGSFSGKSSYTISVNYYNKVSGSELSNMMDKLTPPAGMAFLGWYSDEALTTPVTSAAITGTIYSGNKTYYAKYAESCALTFDANGGSFYTGTENTRTINAAKGSRLGIHVPTMKSTSRKVFEGWFEDAACTKEIKNLYAVEVTGPMTLYAGWTDCYVLTFHTNYEGAKFANGSDTLAIQVVKGTPYRYGEYSVERLYEEPEMTISSDTKKPVSGWYTNADATGTKYGFSRMYHYSITDGKQTSYYGGFVPTADMDFYARWEDPITITFDANGGIFDEYYYEDEDDPYSSTDGGKTVTIVVGKGITLNEISSRYGIPYPSWNGSGSKYSSTWYYDKAGKKYASYSDELTANTTLYVFWRSSSGGSSSSGKKIIYYAGEGFFDEDPTERTYETTYYSGSTYSYPRVYIADPEKAFTGWYTDEALTKPYAYMSEDNYGRISWTFPKAVSKLYAGYGKAYTVTLDANGGYFDQYNPENNQTAGYREVNPDEFARSATEVSLKAAIGRPVDIASYTGGVRRDGDKLFAGWYLDAAGTRKASTWNPSTSTYYELFKAESPVTLYAKWVDYSGVEKLAVSAGTTSLNINESTQLTATLTPASENASDMVKWYLTGYSIGKSNKNRITPAILTKSGKVTAKAEGKIYVVAEVNGLHSDTLTISVSNKVSDVVETIPLEEITLDKTELTMRLGESASIGITKIPTDATEPITCTSSDTNVVAAANNGALYAMGAGEASVTVTGGSLAPQTVKVSVKAVLEDAAISAVSTMNTGDLNILSAKLWPQGVKADCAWSVSLMDGTDAVEYVTLTPSNDGTTAILEAKKTGRVKISLSAADRENADVVKTAEKVITILSSDLSNQVSSSGSDTAVIEGLLAEQGKSLWIEGLKESYTWYGVPVEPDVLVYSGNTRLRLGRDYTIAFKNNKAATDKAEINITGKGNYSGKLTQTFKITAAAPAADAVSLKKAKIAKIAPQEYTGSPIMPVPVVTLDGQTITHGYVISYSKNVDAGTATLVVAGDGSHYKDAVKTTFKITAVDLSKAGNKLNIEAADAAYLASGAKPEVTVTYTAGDTVWTLKEGTDYKLSYANNKAVATKDAAKAPAVTVTGMGNFAKKAPAVKFNIVPGDLSETLFSAPDVNFKANQKKGTAFQSKVKIYGADGKVLKANKDYTLVYKDLSADVVLDAKTTAADMAKVASGDLIMVTATGTGAYEGVLSDFYSLGAVKDLSKAKVTIPAQTWTGEAIEPVPTVTLKVGSANTALVKDTHYSITYINNINKGTATVLLQGNGEYSGVKTATFKINATAVDKLYAGAWNGTGFTR